MGCWQVSLSGDDQWAVGRVSLSGDDQWAVERVSFFLETPSGLLAK